MKKKRRKRKRKQRSPLTNVWCGLRETRECNGRVIDHYVAYLLCSANIVIVSARPQVLTSNVPPEQSKGLCLDRVLHFIKAQFRRSVMGRSH